MPAIVCSAGRPAQTEEARRGPPHENTPPCTALKPQPGRMKTTVLSAQGGPFRALDNDSAPITELRKTERIVRAYRWQRRRNRVRTRVLRTHTRFLESFGLSDQGWLTPSVILGLPAFLVGVLISLAFHFSTGVTLGTAAGCFLFATAWAAFFYHGMPHNRIEQELKRLQDKDAADQENMHSHGQRHNHLMAIVEKMRLGEAERAYKQRQIEFRQVEKAQRLKTLLGYQQEDPWGTVAIVFSCLSLVLAILGFCLLLLSAALGMFTYIFLALPFALIGLVCSSLSKSERMGVALTFGLLTISPILLGLLFLFARAIFAAFR
jgi:hypothetical protein